MASTAVIDTPELLEHILVHLETKTLLLSQRTCKQFKNTVAGSPLLQYALFYTPDKPKNIPEDDIKANLLFREHDMFVFEQLLSPGRVVIMSWRVGLWHHPFQLDPELFLPEIVLPPPPIRTPHDLPRIFTFWYDEEKQQKELTTSAGNESWRRMYIHRDRRMVWLIQGRCHQITDCHGPDSLWVDEDYVTMGELVDRAATILKAHWDDCPCLYEEWKAEESDFSET